MRNFLIILSHKTTENNNQNTKCLLKKARGQTKSSKRIWNENMTERIHCKFLFEDVILKKRKSGAVQNTNSGPK